MRLLTAAAVLAAVVCAARPAAAQEETRFFLYANGAFEPGSQSYKDDATFRLYDEDGRLSVQSEVSSGAVLDFGVGARVLGNWTAGAGFHRTSSTDPATVGGAAPHPIFFDRPRSFSLTVEDLKRSEQALHLSVGYMMHLTERVTVHAYAGPSQFRFSQEVPATVAVAETSSTFTSVQATATTAVRKRNAWGGHLALDLNYMVVDTGTAVFAIGGYVRYAEASSSFQVVNGTTSTKVGGTQFGAGLRVRF